MTAETILSLIAGDLLGIAICAVGIVLALRLTQKEKTASRLYLALFALLACLSVAGMLFALSEGLEGASAEPLYRLGTFLAQGCNALYYLSLTCLLLRFCCETDWRTNPLFHVSAVLCVLGLLLTPVDAFSNLHFFYDESGAYQQGPWFAPFAAMPVVPLLVSVVFLLLRWKKLTGGQRLIYIAIAFTALTTGLRAVLLLLWMMEEQRSRYLQQEAENARARQQLLMMQMRSHFIYNTMMSIYYLCDSDPKEAQRVCGNFTTYLQGTFTALGDSEPIPFTQELQHTQAYLAVEQARYPDMIVLEYDTPYTAFTLPALTLQPLVENAVKHGFDPDRGPLHILIRTRAQDTGSELTVEDDGSGFSGPEDAEAHVALDNIRSRLAMNGGTLTIAARAGGGTVVTVVTVREAVKNKKTSRGTKWTD